MASLIPGYEYDIFISYRQKDNKGERWVSEFVEALRIELESTFKEEISVYFDINPHDGLLETHDVDESLKQKLKCLIFIPVISRTYCDPNSFAWEHEFKAFVEQASLDQYGLKVKLSSGNVSSRVLPVRIHELYTEDVKLCESLTDGVLRGVEFIYKEPGVNRPLTLDDDEKLNLNKTKYRNQINKVANAVNDIIRSLKFASLGPEAEISGPGIVELRKNQTSGNKVGKILLGNNPKRGLSVLLAVIILLTGAFIIFRISNLKNTEKTLALIPLRISNFDTILRAEGDYFMESLTDKLNLIRKINLKPTISTHAFRNTEKSLEEISKEIGANYLIDGNIRREGDNTKIWIELSAMKKKNLLWSNTYVWDKNKVPLIMNDIIGSIAKELDIELSSEEKKQIVSEPSRFPVASQNYFSANIMLRDAWSYVNYGDKMLDSVSFMSAIEIYDKAIREDSLFAIAYAKRALAITWGIFSRQLDSSYFEKCLKDIEKAMQIDKDLPDTQIALGFYYYFCEIDNEKALFYFSKAVEMDPDNYQPLYYQSLVYRKMGRWAESQSLINRVIRLDPQEALFLTNIGLSFDYLHRYDSAIMYHQKAIDLVPGWPAAHINKINSLILRDGKTNEARMLLAEAIKKTGDTMVEDRIVLSIYEGRYDKAFMDALNSHDADFNLQAARLIYLGTISHLLDRPAEMKNYLDSALVLLYINQKSDPFSPIIHGYIGLVNAYLGNRGKAVEEGEKAIMLSVKNKTEESDMKINLALIYLKIEEFDKSFSLIAYLLNNPSMLSKELLKLNPVWKPLIALPEYSESLKQF